MVKREAKWCMGHRKTQSPGIIHRMSSVERKCIVVRDYMHAHSEGKMRDSIMKKRIVYFLDFSCAFLYLLLRFDHLLHDLGFFNEESTHDASVQAK